MKKKKKRSAGGNYGKPSLKNGVTPEYLTFPLTAYESVPLTKTASNPWKSPCRASCACGNLTSKTKNKWNHHLQGPGLPARIYAGEHSSPLQVCFQFGFIKARDDVGIVPYNPVETFWKNRRDGKPIPYKNFQNVPEYFVGAGSSGPHLCGRTQGLFSVWFYQGSTG